MFRSLRARQVRSPSEDQILKVDIIHSAQTSTLAIEFSDGTIRTHVAVMQGHIVGLPVAADKLAFYQDQIAPSNLAIELTIQGRSPAHSESNQ